jgi:hypothetical protein
MLVWFRVLTPLQTARAALQMVPSYKLETLTFLKCAPSHVCAIRGFMQVSGSQVSSAAHARFEVFCLPGDDVEDLLENLECC